MSRGVWLVVLLAAPLFFWRLDRPGFGDTEGMFAEPAREMVVSGDWVTPTMNGEPFLTKPPLMYWLPALVFSVEGPTEYARIAPALAALATVAVTGALGTALAGEATGVAAALVLATAAGFFLESRMLRADMVLVLSVTLALWNWVRLRRGGGLRTAIAFWLVIGFGLLDKGLLAVLLPGATIGLAEAWEGVLRPRTLVARLRALWTPLGMAILALVALPWHLLAGARNPGFLWDYIVNQHLLFFFDQKLPRDSIPDGLGFFLAMFVVRGLPWSLFLPAALVTAWRAREEPLVRLAGAWVAVVLVLFGLAAGRLEHYSLPALPAVALLVGFAWTSGSSGRTPVGRVWFVIPPLVVGALVLSISMANPASFLDALDPTLSAYHLAPLVRPALLTLGTGLLAVVAALWGRRELLALGAGVVTAVALFGFGQVAHERVEPLFSWRPFARTIRETIPAGTPIFFRASDEYQLCGGLDYYTEGHVHLLAPAGWVAPTFLATRTDRLFTPREVFQQAWQDGNAVLVSDDVVAQADEAALAPGPYVVAARAGERVVLRPIITTP